MAHSLGPKPTPASKSAGLLADIARLPQLDAPTRGGLSRQSAITSPEPAPLLLFPGTLEFEVRRSFLAVICKKRLAVRPLLLLCALVFAFISSASAAWKEKVLHSFQSVPDGATPLGGVVLDKAGNLYGTTINGGSSSCHSVAQCGIVFQLVPPTKKGGPWTEAVLHVFRGNSNNDGASPAGGLIIDSAGNLYGTTAYGGTGNCVVLGILTGCGAVFEMSPPLKQAGRWKEKLLYSFPTAKQGFLPQGDLVFDSAGNLYGATEFGGGHGTTCNGFY